jgi:hypothetical protein
MTRLMMARPENEWQDAISRCTNDSTLAMGDNDLNDRMDEFVQFLQMESWMKLDKEAVD